MCSETEYMSSLQWAHQNQAQALDSGVVFVSGTSRMTREYPLFLAVESLMELPLSGMVTSCTNNPCCHLLVWSMLPVRSFVFKLGSRCSHSSLLSLELVPITSADLCSSPCPSHSYDSVHCPHQFRGNFAEFCRDFEFIVLIFMVEIRTGRSRDIFNSLSFWINQMRISLCGILSSKYFNYLLPNSLSLLFLAFSQFLAEKTSFL